MTRTPIAIALLLGLGQAGATPPLNQPGTLSYTCAGQGNGNAYLGIEQETSFVAGEHKCREAFDPLMGSVGSKAAYTSVANGSGSSRGTARMGTLKAVAANNALAGVAGRAIVGFNDRLSFTAPGHSGQVQVTYRFSVGGTIDAHGPSGSARLRLEGYIGSGYIPGKSWSVSTDIWTPDATLPIAEVLELTANVTLDTATDWSHVMTLTNGTRSVGGTGHGSSTAKQPGAVWKGIVRVTQNGVDLPNWSVQSASGIDWHQACPCNPP